MSDAGTRLCEVDRGKVEGVSGVRVERRGDERKEKEDARRRGCIILPI
jgi:hypothetical protein